MDEENGGGGGGATCVELALEGERLCKAGDCVAGVRYFEAAVRAGTDDLRTLSAIYSQLGNAYFYLQEYDRALEYHGHDLELARTMADKVGEAKARGNLGNTLKVLGRFDEAIACCSQHLDISRSLNDRVSVARALYNLGNVYHTKGKQACSMAAVAPSTGLPDDAAMLSSSGECTGEACDDLLKAVEYYRANLELVSEEELGDRAAQGRAHGNLGNTYYLLGKFSEAILQHEKRLAIAKEFGDKGAERRAHSNLGNAYVFLGDFDRAAEHYKKALQTARQLGDLALEAQACYSLGNAHTLLRDHARALECHERHLQIAQELNDKLGQSRGYWSLGNALAGLGHQQRALACALKHLEISKEIGDEVGIAAASANLEGLQSGNGAVAASVSSTPQRGLEHRDGMKRVSMDSLDLLRMTPSPIKPVGAHFVKSAAAASDNVKSGSTMIALTPSVGSAVVVSDLSGRAEPARPAPEVSPAVCPSPLSLSAVSVNSSFSSNVSANDEDDFFDMLSKFQGRRLDDQRTSVRVLAVRGSDQKKKEDLMDMVAGVQGNRINNQRASFAPPLATGLAATGAAAAGIPPLAAIGQMLNGGDVPDDRFFEMLMRTQSSRIEEQRSSLPHHAGVNAGGDGMGRRRAPTVPDEDFFSLIQRLQSSRLDEQRYELKKPPTTASVSMSYGGAAGSSGGSSSNAAAATSLGQPKPDRTRSNSTGKNKKK